MGYGRFTPVNHDHDAHIYCSTGALLMPGPAVVRVRVQHVPASCPSCGAPPEDTDGCRYCGRSWLGLQR